MGHWVVTTILRYVVIESNRTTQPHLLLGMTRIQSQYIRQRFRVKQFLIYIEWTRHICKSMPHDITSIKIICKL